LRNLSDVAILLLTKMTISLNQNRLLFNKITLKKLNGYDRLQ